MVNLENTLIQQAALTNRSRSIFLKNSLMMNTRLIKSALHVARVTSVTPEYDQLSWVIIHGRGVLNTGHGTTFAQTLATAGVLSGRESYFYMRYDDSPERDSIPMIFYTVMGNPNIEVTLHEEVEPVGQIFSAIVVMEPTILIGQTSQRALLFDGAKKDAVLVVNTSLSPKEVIGLLKKRCLAQDWCGKLVAIRARNYDRNIAFPLLAALAKAWNVVGLDDLLNALDSSGLDSKAGVIKKAYSEAEPVDVTVSVDEAQMARVRRSRPPSKLKKGKWDLNLYRHYQKAAAGALSYGERIAVMPSWKALPPGLVEFGPPPGKKNIGFTTSFARYLRPVIDKGRCSDCKMCSIYCPDGAINFNRVEVDLNYCKGCGICSRVCASKAINMKGESLAAEGLAEKEITTIEDALVEYGY
jgi:2-oxoacid:acceptor oxidoreductase delta subunit (pyruvate/2-ketoisovalerate family)